MSMTLLTLDFETYYDTQVSLTKLTTMEYIRDPLFKVWGVGLKFDDEETFWVGEDEAESEISDIDWDTTAIVCHNTPFDGFILTHHYQVTPKYYYDTAAMSRGLWPSISAKLKDVAERTFPDDPTMRKGDELANAKGVYDLPPDLEESIAGYCIQDVDLTYAIYKNLIGQYPQSELDIINMTTRMFCEPLLHINRAALEESHQDEKDHVEDIISKSGYTRTQLGSPVQFKKIVEDDLNIVCPLKPNSKGEMIPAFSKNDAGWKQMVTMYPQFNHVWDARVALKANLKETRSKRFIDAADPDKNTLPTCLRYYGAHTGRWTGIENLNQQNLPRGSILRTSLEAPPGHLLYVADLSNIEARIVAWLAGQDDLVEGFAEGRDIYSEFASDIYGRTITKQNDPLERFIGKQCILGLQFGMGYQRFMESCASGAKGPAVEFSIEKAKSIVNNYRSKYNKIDTLWKRVESKLVTSMHDPEELPYGSALVFKNGNIELPNGMSLKYHNLQIIQEQLTYFNHKGPIKLWGGKITENIAQALARIVITDAMLKLENTICSGRIALTVHDEVILVAPDKDPDAIMNQIFEIMCIQPRWATDLPLAVEGGYDKSYSK